MSLVSQISDVVTQIGTEIKSTRGDIGKLSSLSTTAKDNLVAAVNELQSSISGAGASINDSGTSTSSVWSSSHTSDKIDAAINALVDGAPGAMDTLKELADALDDDSDFHTTVTTALGNRLRVDVVQSLDSGQKAQGISNLGAISANDIGEVTTDFVDVLNASLT